MRFVSVVKNTGGMDPEAQTKTCHVNTVRRDSSHGHDVHTRGMPRSVTVTSDRLAVCARGHKNWASHKVSSFLPLSAQIQNLSAAVR